MHYSKNTLLITLSIASLMFVNACKKDKDEAPTATPTPTPIPVEVACTPKTSFTPDAAAGPRLIFKFKFDSTQTRLNNLGVSSPMAAGHAGQSPLFKAISQHYIELAGDMDQVGGGTVLYIGTQTTSGGDKAIDYCSSVITGENEVFFSKALSQIDTGTYKWLRVSLAYQNYDITFKDTIIPGNHLAKASLSSFIGFNTYLTNYTMNGTTYSPSASAGGKGNHKQGYWAFETTVLGSKYFVDGQAPEGLTTVPNPLHSTSPIPAGSCLVTGQFVDNGMNTSPLVITGNETSDIIITVSLSTNKSFEWIDNTPDGYYEPKAGEKVVDMGIRGLIPIKN